MLLLINLSTPSISGLELPTKMFSIINKWVKLKVYTEHPKHTPFFTSLVRSIVVDYRQVNQAVCNVHVWQWTGYLVWWNNWGFFLSRYPVWGRISSFDKNFQQTGYLNIAKNQLYSCFFIFLKLDTRFCRISGFLAQVVDRKSCCRIPANLCIDPSLNLSFS